MNSKGSENSTLASTKGTSYQGEARILVAAIVEICLCLLGSTGNLMTCLAVLRNRTLQFATNFFIVSLAVADLLVCIILVPMRASQHFAFFLGKPDISSLGVTVAGFLGRVNILASICNLGALSIDRCLALNYPMKYRFGIRYATGRVLGVIVSFWVFAITFTSLPYVPGITDDVFQIGFIVFVLSVTLVIMVAYFRIFHIADQARRRRRKVAVLEIVLQDKSSKRKANLSSNTDEPAHLSDTRLCSEVFPIPDRRFLNVIPKHSQTKKSSSMLQSRGQELFQSPDAAMLGSNSFTVKTNNNKALPFYSDSDDRPKVPQSDNNAMRKDQHRDYKTTKTIGIVIGALILLVYPRIIMILYHYANPSTLASELATFWVRILLYSNSVINPMLYAWRMREFRMEFGKIIFSVLRCGRVSNQSPSHQTTRTSTALSTTNVVQ
ncbi:adenosine receptor A2b-like [Exaiptasia diaphana]|uniref:G-protein coupled receptors family 1 profile domain-containing protein n=1 Tax=Exaiptasia diaphana TaxID=2652724 RepID=A0A913X0F9_EXADI|nr:adenosine receptor A2b-like [Exaiptasia diaphana]